MIYGLRRLESTTDLNQTINNINKTMESFKLTIPRPTKAPTPQEEMLKLDLLEITRKPKENIHQLFDEVCIAIRNKGMSHTHKVIIIDDHVIEVVRIMHDLAILRLAPKREEVVA